MQIKTSLIHPNLFTWLLMWFEMQMPKVSGVVVDGLQHEALLVTLEEVHLSPGEV